jgi:PAS domain S-box-containing protein
MLNLAHDAISIRDLDNRITYWNRSAERIYGWSSAEAVGQTTEALLRLDSFRFSAASRQLREKGYWIGELTARAKDGHEVLIEATWTLIRDQQGQPKVVLATSEDITERRRLEQQSTRNQRIESLGTLASGVAHDLNNILTPIMVSISLLKEQSKDPTLTRLLDNLNAGTQRGAQLVKQILTFGHGVKGERSTVSLREIAREIQQLVREAFPKSIEFEIVAPADLWFVTGDHTQLHQVLLNLAINARDAMPTGGKLTLTFQNHVIDPIYAGLNPEARPGPNVLIQVADTGTGMSREIIDRIFDPFFTTKPTGQGTGLGLSTTLGIVKSHGGVITVYSEPGQGSTFKIYLPANPTREQTKQQSVDQSGLPLGRNEFILFVDDEEAIRNAVKKTLERFGYRVLTAANGAEAVSIYAARSAEIAVVITDMNMPVMDGPATIIALQSINPRVKIIGSSGLASNGSVAMAASSGVRHFVPKPYTAEKMLHTLRAVLDDAPAPKL